MKHLFTIALLAVSISAHSQKVITGSFYLPIGEKYLRLDWDFSYTIFEKKLNETEWKATNGEKEWETAKSEAMAVILREMNGKMEKSRILVVAPESSVESKYTLYICPLRLNRKGDNKTRYVLKEDATGYELGICQLSGDGGSFGSLGNLLGDGYEEEARKMGKFLKSNNKMK